MFKRTQGCPQSTSDVLQRSTNEKPPMGNEMWVFPMNGFTGVLTACFLASCSRFQPQHGCDTQERAPARGALTWFAAAGLPLRPVPDAFSTGDFSVRGRFARAFSFCFAPRFSARPGEQRRAGPAAATAGQGARPARPRAAASLEAEGRQAEETEAKPTLKGRRRTCPGAAPAAMAGAASPRPFSGSSEPPTPQRPPHLSRGQWRQLPHVDRDASHGLPGVVVPGGTLPVWWEAPPLLVRGASTLGVRGAVD